MPDPFEEAAPASDELCAKLGINPSDLGALPRRHGSQPALPTRRPLAPVIPEENVSTKEAVLTVLATYIANKDEDWWELMEAERDEEICFVADALVRTYRKLEPR